MYLLAVMDLHALTAKVPQCIITPDLTFIHQPSFLKKQFIIL